MKQSPQNHNPSEMRLYDERRQRLYVNASERLRFLDATNQETDQIRAFCLTLLYTGCRLSEAIELRRSSIQLEARLISIRTLKKRQKNVVREVPIPPVLAEALVKIFTQSSSFPDPDSENASALWIRDGIRINRSTGYRWIKAVMREANITGAQACPKGLRHGYGIHAIGCGVQLNMLKKWMGHASMSTTAIYANAVGREEMEIAERMWTLD